MKKAYIIAAHKYPEHLNRIISRLNDGESTFFIHIDKKIDIRQFKDLSQFGDNVKYVDRVNSGWASFGEVKASLKAMKAVVDTGEPFEMVSFMSGQDYPIKPNSEIDRIFGESEHSIFLDYVALPDYEKWPNHGSMWRFDKYFFGPGKYKQLLGKVVSKIAKYFPPLRKKYLPGIKTYFGSNWFSMDLQAVKYILQYVDAHPEYSAFHKYNFSPGELFYQMILLNSPDKAITDRIVNDNKRLIKWKSWTAPNPEILTSRNFDEIKASNALFARKFDPLIDAEILNRIDNEILYFEPYRSQLFA